MKQHYAFDPPHKAPHFVDIDVIEEAGGLEAYVTKLEAETTRRNERDTCIASLEAFVVAHWSIVEPERPFSPNWHISELCRVLEDMAWTKEQDDHGQDETFVAQAWRDVEHERIRRVIINVPPGTMKSLLISVFWPCWLWARNPKLRILTLTYSDKRALDANLKARKILTSPTYQRLFPLKFAEDQDAKGRFDTTEGGWRIASSVGGEGTGLHPDIIIIDDASTAQDATSDAARKAVTDWFQGTIASRGVSRNVMVVVIGQRLHEEDLSGFLLSSPGARSWKHVCLPMRYEPTREATDQDPGWTAYPRDPRTQVGELLWPSLYPEEKVLQLELDLVEDAPGQLQQNPTPKGGRLFRVEEFKFYEQAPACMRVARGWDTGGTEGGGDPTCGVKIGEEVTNGEATGRFFILDEQHAQLESDGVEKLITTTAKIDGVRCAQREEREGGSSGKAVTRARSRSLKGYDYEEVLAGTNKRVKSKPFRAQVNAGNVYLPKDAPWVRGYVAEMRDFPNGKHDDRVDASAIAFNAVLLMDVENALDGKVTW